MTLEDLLKDLPISRKPGQDFSGPGHALPVPSDRVGHKADPDSYLRSRKGPYKRKIARQRKAKNS